jgi:hypothetical protein
MSLEDMRRSPRRRAFLGGRVHYKGLSSSADCLIRDVSATGARIAFTDPTPLPDHFELEVLSTGERRKARLVWTRGLLAGVEYED